jgi:predicted acylesterase/phospholipase RssA
MPRALILKGGGVKGLAFVGALKTLEEFDLTFDTFVGTSAGAITAVLLASGYTATELEIAMSRKDFTEFLDGGGRIASLWRLIRRGWIHTGEPIVDWIESLLRAKFPQRHSAEKVRLDELPRRVVLYAARSSGGEVVFDSRLVRASYSASVAARYSASIPGFFRDEKFELEPIYDGGMLNNFPVEIFLRDNPDEEFIALNLLETKKKGASPWIVRLPLVRLLIAVVNIQLKQREPQILQKYASRIVNINTGEVETTQFCLSNVEKDFLVAAGRCAALQFIARHMPERKLSATLLINETERTFELARLVDVRRRIPRRFLRKVPRKLLLLVILAVLCV